MNTFTVDEIKALKREEPEDEQFLRQFNQRSDSRVVPLTPWGPEERLKAFREIGFHPHGLFLPDDDELRKRIKTVVSKLGQIEDADKRLQGYIVLQEKTATFEAREIPGLWTGQQGVARSTARFRLVRWGRRAGKSAYAAAEGVAFAVTRPRSVIWVTASIMDLVERPFTYVVQTVLDLGLKTLAMRDSAQHKLIVLENGSRIEGISLDEPKHAAGAKVDLAICDEAGQMTEAAWTRAIIPPLTDRNGQALLIGSPEGDEGFFYEKAEKEQEAGTGTWEIFESPSYDINFFHFPQGINTPVLQDARREMAPIEFLEQFGAIPARGRDRVYIEFKAPVHVGRYGFNPEHPVVLACDPSGGVNPYAVVAIQDYGTWFAVIDEYYEKYVTIEAVAPELDRRPWRSNVTAMVVDSALPAEIERWNRLGYPAEAVEKPKVWERIPLHRNALRDPLRFYHLHQQLIAEVLTDEFGVEKLEDLREDEQAVALLKLEERLSDERIKQRQIEALRFCSRMFINETCTWTIWEHKHYKYDPKTRSINRNGKEAPLDSQNHICDSLGYFLWQYKRFDDAFVQGDYSYIIPAGTPRYHAQEDPLPPTGDDEPIGVDRQRHRGYLQTVRRDFSPKQMRSMLVAS